MEYCPRRISAQIRCPRNAQRNAHARGCRRAVGRDADDEAVAVECEQGERGGVGVFDGSGGGQEGGEWGMTKKKEEEVVVGVVEMLIMKLMG